VLPKYPQAAGSLFQAYNDILLGEDYQPVLFFMVPRIHLSDAFSVQQWTDVQVVDLEGVSRAAITGKKPKTVRSCVAIVRSP
jgi:tRNA-splicing endonuclease subunit Sen15